MLPRYLCILIKDFKRPKCLIILRESSSGNIILGTENTGGKFQGPKDVSGYPCRVPAFLCVKIVL